MPTTTGDLTRTVVLGLLAMGPSHGYGLRKQLDAARADAWAGIKPSSVHGMLDRLARDGLVELMATAKAGSRPPRAVYRITPAGRQELDRLMEAAWSVPLRVADPIDAAIVLNRLVPADRAARLLDERRETLLRALGELDNAWEQVQNDDAGIQALVADLFDHRRRKARLALEWTDHLLAQVASGEWSAAPPAPPEVAP